MRDGELRVPTRMRPKRMDELVGGYLHWIIKHRIVARQQILRFDDRKDGRVDGTGEAVGLGRLARPTDSGRWWISGNRLCQRWQTWYNGQQMCFQLVSLGGDRLRWTQDNGDTGIARIGN